MAELTPREVAAREKICLPLDGLQTLDQVRAMVGRLLGRPGQVLSEDLADALAVALCHGSSRRHLELVERALSGPGRTGRGR